MHRLHPVEVLGLAIRLHHSGVMEGVLLVERKPFHTSLAGIERLIALYIESPQYVVTEHGRAPFISVAIFILYAQERLNATKKLGSALLWCPSTGETFVLLLLKLLLSQRIESMRLRTAKQQQTKK